MYDCAIAEHKLPAKQYPTLEGLKTILASDPKAKGAKAEDFVDSPFHQRARRERHYRQVV